MSKTKRDGDVSHQRHGAVDSGLRYGTTDGQFGSLPPGSLDATLAPGAGLDAALTAPTPMAARTPAAPIPSRSMYRGEPLRYVQYGADAVAGSPPHCHGLGKEHTYADDSKRSKDGHRRIFTEKGIADPYYGQAIQRNWGNLPAGRVEAVVQGDLASASPPYVEGTMRVLANAPKSIWETALAAPPNVQTQPQTIRAMVPPTANSAIPKATHSGLRQNRLSLKRIRSFALVRHAIWVTKHYIRDGKLVDFPGDWDAPRGALRVCQPSTSTWPCWSSGAWRRICSRAR